MQPFRISFTGFNSKIKAVVTAGLLLLLFSLPTLAASGGSYDLSWDTLDGGGQTSSGGSRSVSGAIGQPDAGPAMTGGSYTLTGGFWTGAGGPTGATLYLPVVLKN